MFIPRSSKSSPPLRWFALAGAIALGSACDDRTPGAVPEAAAPPQGPAPKVDTPPVPTEPRPPELLEPVDLWKDGKPTGQIDAQGPAAADHVFLDLGEGWTPILFSDGQAADGKPLPHSFGPTYHALARGEFKKDDPFYDRAREDKYLELYGIMPTLSVLRTRLHWAEKLECVKTLDLSAIESFNGVVAYTSPEEAKRTRERYLVARKYVERFLAEQQVSDPSLLNYELLKDGERAQVKYYLRNHDDYEAIKAAQDRLACEGYFKGKGRWQKGAFDWATHEALAEFERRHRVYSWGAMGPDTLTALRMDTAKVEHETVVRVLTERALHAFGALEDGSAVKGDKPVTFTGADGKLHEVPNLEDELRKSVVQAFGLHDPASTAAFL
ncbi:MAG TPA: peptidoglycan-binding protein, partial [Polyangiales bacterium]